MVFVDASQGERSWGGACPTLTSQTWGSLRGFAPANESDVPSATTPAKSERPGASSGRGKPTRSLMHSTTPRHCAMPALCDTASAPSVRPLSERYCKIFQGFWIGSESVGSDTELLGESPSPFSTWCRHTLFAACTPLQNPLHQGLNKQQGRRLKLEEGHPRRARCSCPAPPTPSRPSRK